MFGTLLDKPTLRSLDARLEKLQVAAGKIECLSQRLAGDTASFESAEFSVFSQFGEDGLIQFLLSRVPVAAHVFVEIGVGDYIESNTRFLLLKDYWSGLVIDNSKAHIQSIRRSEIFWRRDLRACCAWVTPEDVNRLLTEHGIAGPIGLLSIDIDGNDYWVWKAIDVVAPTIVVVEYNAIFGPAHRVTIPYQQDFARSRAHYSNLYYGASIAALADLGERKGYLLAGANRAGNNLFFVKKDAAAQIHPRIARGAYRPAGFRESRDRRGRLSFLTAEEGIRLIGHLPVVDLERGGEVPIHQLR